MIISPETCDKFRFGREETQKLLQKLKDDVNGLKKHKKLYFQHFFDDQQSNTTEFINLFQKNPNLCYEYNKNGNLPIHEAIIGANIKYLKILHGICPDSLFLKTKNDYFPIDLAVDSGRVESLRYICKFSSCTGTNDKVKGSILCRSIFNKRFDIFKTIIETFPQLISQQITEEQQKPIHIACHKNELDFVKLILDHQKDEVKSVDSSGNFCQHYAARLGDFKIIQYLSTFYDDKVEFFESQNNFGFTMLHIACKSGKIDLIKFLIKERPQLMKIANAKGEFPFHIASRERHYEILHYLFLKENFNLL